ncbi:MAG TPA: MBOAT family O-acyltransferase [Candidatus Polarisedimenticolia bacterium]|nr:MBOAT family O-acyltransferase [Candidatus Polarisedimenticolia bacterium]
MLEFIPLPGLWLLFLLLGLIPAGRSLLPRQIAVVLASLGILCAATGWQTAGFYASLGLVVVLLGEWLQRAREGMLRRTVFVLSVAGMAGVLVVYLAFRTYIQKYFVGLPSLSYLAFRGIALLASCRARSAPGPAAGCLQMMFMPAMPTGPITRVENFMAEQRDDARILKRLAAGFAMLIGGRLANHYVLDRVAESAGLAAWRYWLGAVANSFDLYLTFAGFTHLILGLGLLVGFRLPDNFNNPYLATSIGDFWRRWHISLSFWIRDYLYIPLGGSRKGVARKCVNLMIAMGVCGAWHGLEAHYVIWGLYHGALLSIESLLSAAGWHPLTRLAGPLYRPIKVVIVFALATFGWLLFRYQIPDFNAYLQGMLAR